MTWYSQHGQDAYLAREVFPNRRGGVFIEAGGRDGIADSNTLHFEREMGWSGLVIEPDPRYTDELRKNRPKSIIAALWRHNGFVPFTRAESHGHSRAGSGALLVPCLKLGDLYACLSGAALDLVCLDIEGDEAEVIRDSVLVKYRVVDVWQIENNAGDDSIAKIMEPAGYRKINHIGHDEFWRRRL